MNIPSKYLFQILIEKGVEELHHANSVATACQFLRSKSLMSRGAVERRGLAQTPQKSDNLDKEYGIWFDVFADSVDIHNRGGRANSYGPVMFVLDAKIIQKFDIGRVWITKLNPTKWASVSIKERWFRGKEDLKENLDIGEFDQMIVFRHCGGELPFNRFLKKIVLDDPGLLTEDNIDIYSMAVGALRLAMQDAGIDIPIEHRKCSRSCLCKAYWAKYDRRLFRMFDPKI